MIRLPKWFLLILALAVLVGLTTSASAADTTKGKIKSVTVDKKEFVMTDQNNKDWTFTLDDNTKIRLADKDVKLDDLKAGDEVEIKYEKKGDKLIAQDLKCERK